MGTKNCDKCVRAAGGRNCRYMYTSSNRCWRFKDRRYREPEKDYQPKQGEARYLQYLSDKGDKKKR